MFAQRPVLEDMMLVFLSRKKDGFVCVPVCQVASCVHTKHLSFSLERNIISFKTGHCVGILEKIAWEQSLCLQDMQRHERSGENYLTPV